MRGAYDDHEFVMVCPVAYSGDHLVPRPAVLHIAGCERDECGVALSVMPALELQELFNKFAWLFLVSSPSGLAASDSWILKMAETVLCHPGVAGVGKWRLLGLPLRLSQAASVSLLVIVGCKQAEKSGATRWRRGVIGATPETRAVVPCSGQLHEHGYWFSS